MTDTQKPSILFAIPAFGGQTTDKFTTGMFELGKELTRRGIRSSLLMVSNESLICRGRSRLFSFFYNNTDFDYLMFIDADIGFKPEDIMKLLELDVPFACAGVPLKGLKPTYNFGLVTNTDDSMIWNKDHTAFMVDYVGTAFMLLHRRVYSILSSRHPELKYTPPRGNSNMPASDAEVDNSYYLFQTGIVNGDLKSEDYMFCKRWRDVGGEIWLRPDIELTHTGSHVFTGINLQEFFKGK